jgi:hypothetical protein
MRRDALATLPQLGASTTPATGSTRGGGWDVHRARGDSLFTTRTVLSQLDWVSAERVARARSRTHEWPAPNGQGTHHETKATPAVGEGVGSTRRTLGVKSARHQPLALHSPQTVGKQLRRDAGQLVAEVLKSRRAAKEVADDEERPALAYEIE